ncbi:MAG TPA: ATP-binding protein [Myxococcaceae bacterium]|jgi:signal transduction histidine kinase
MRHLLAGLAVLALMIALVGGLSAFVLRQTVSHKDEVISRYSQDLLALDDFIATNERAARKARSFLLTANPRFLQERKQAREEMERQLAGLSAREQSSEGKLLLERIAELEATLGREFDVLLERRQQGLDADEAGRLMEQTIQPDRDELDAVLARLKRHKSLLLEEAKQNAGRTASRAFLLLTISIGASILLSGLLAYSLMRSWQRLMDASVFQQRVIAIVGHDVRSPLAAILASTSHAIMRKDLEPRIEGLLARVLRSARRIEVLTKLLMDFSQVRVASGLNLAHEPADMHVLCEDVLKDLRGTWKDRQLVLEKEGDGRGDFDKDRLHQVLANLVDNALRHGATGTTVRMLSRGANPSILEVSIHNEGPPIDPKLMPRIFEPFQHGEHSQDVVRESLGMGLYIVSEVVKAHGGKVHVESTRERGTIFTVRVPRMPVPPEKPLQP